RFQIRAKLRSLCGLPFWRCVDFTSKTGEPQTAALLEGTRMMSIGNVPTYNVFVRCLFGVAVLLVLATAPKAQGQTASNAIYGVPAFDVAPAAAREGVALLKQYRDGALKQAGNRGVTLLQEFDWPNRFIIYDAWQDQTAYDTNEKAAHSAALRDKLKAM